MGRESRDINALAVGYAPAGEPHRALGAKLTVSVQSGVCEGPQEKEQLPRNAVKDKVCGALGVQYSTAAQW